jgi:uncharacterized protein YqhQ
MVTQTVVLLGALSSQKLLSSTCWQCATRFNSYVFSLKFHKELKRVFEEKANEHKKACEEFDNLVDANIKKSKEIL